MFVFSFLGSLQVCARLSFSGLLLLHALCFFSFLLCMLCVILIFHFFVCFFGFFPTLWRSFWNQRCGVSSRNCPWTGRTCETFTIRHKLKTAGRELISFVSKNTASSPLNWECDFTFDWNSTSADDRANKSAKDFLFHTPPAASGGGTATSADKCFLQHLETKHWWY